MISFLIQFHDSFFVEHTSAVKCNTKLDRKFGSKIGSPISENWIARTHDPIFKADQRPGKADGQPASRPATSRPPTQPWLAGRLTGQMAAGLVAGWPQSCLWLTTLPAGWTAGWPACCGWLFGVVAGPTDLSGLRGSICSLAGL